MDIGREGTSVAAFLSTEKFLFLPLQFSKNPPK